MRARLPERDSISLKEPVAQPVEHVTFNHGVLGSSPSGLTNEISDLSKLDKVKYEPQKRWGNLSGNDRAGWRERLTGGLANGIKRHSK
jgi:hypothetical protein